MVQLWSESMLSKLACGFNGTHNEVDLDWVVGG